MRLIFLIILLKGTILAQEIERQVINSSGNNYRGENFSLSYSIGETVISTHENDYLILNQGFLQSNDQLTSIDLYIAGINIKAFPNPTTDRIILEIESREISHGGINLRINDLSGKTRQEINYKSIGRHEIDMSDYESGIYFLHLYSGETNKIIKVVKI